MGTWDGSISFDFIYNYQKTALQLIGLALHLWRPMIEIQSKTKEKKGFWGCLLAITLLGISSCLLYWKTEWKGSPGGKWASKSGFMQFVDDWHESTWIKAPYCRTESDAQEGTKSLASWFALGGEQNYTHKKMSQEIVKDPHLFTSSFNKRRFEVEKFTALTKMICWPTMS